MEAICIRSCTVPGLGLVEKGRKVNIPDGPWEKHFEVLEAPRAEVKLKGKKAEKPDAFLDI